jgi:hypothetical protein
VKSFVRRTAVRLAPLLFLFACAKPDPGAGLTPLPELGIQLRIPDGMIPVDAEQMKQLQDSAGEYIPVMPFADFPCYQYYNPASLATVVFSRMDFIDPETAQENPAEIAETYRKNLETYYGVDSIAASEYILDDFSLLSMTLLYEPEGTSLYIIKVLYREFPHRYFMLELFLDGKTANADEIKTYEEMFASVKPLGG